MKMKTFFAAAFAALMAVGAASAQTKSKYRLSHLVG